MALTVAAPAIRPRRVVYIGLSALMAIIAVVGFWPGYFGPLVYGTLVQPLLIHIHATVFTGWLVLFFLQAYFAATKRIGLHLTVGKVGIWYGVMLILVGLTTGVIRAAASPPGRAEGLLLAITQDMLMFAGFFAAAVWYRKKPKVHRPLMVVAATSLLVAAVGRMGPLLPAEPFRSPVAILIWSSPILVAMVLEFRQTWKVHPVYVIALMVFVLRRYSVPLIAPSETWGSFAHWVFGMVA